MTLKLDPENPLATKVQTRDGRKARIICTDYNGLYGEQLLALVAEVGGHECPRGYYNNGCWRTDRNESNHDLINVSETKSFWLNAYDHNICWHDTRKSADTMGGMASGRRALIELRMCDGKLVDAIQHEVE